jgi:acetylornithine deacetylase/succinyl-diaminopimelate desuccinylase-like protein
MTDTARVFAGLDAYVSGVRQEFEERLAQLVEVPTVSMDLERKPDIDRGADLAVEYLKNLGAHAEKVATPGNPVVMGNLVTDPKHPTVVLYNHLDVQPADKEKDGWTTEPFTFVKDNETYRGRGTTDDKGPALTAMFAVRYAVDNGVPLNFKFIWELEEEIGSPNFEHFIKNEREELKTNSVLVSDTIWIARNKPASPYGLRGLMGFTLSLKTGEKDTHSGTTGGAARNPIGELMQLVSQCYDARTGKVKIPGFYDDVKKPSTAEIKSYLASGFDARRFTKVYQFKSIRSTDSARVLQSIMAEPTFEVHGLVGGYTGKGIKTIVPHWAEVKCSTRLVPNQNPAKIFRLIRDFVKQKNPDVKITHEATLRPYLGQFQGPYAAAASEAMQYAFGEKPAFTREGGSIGAVVTMEKYLRVPIVFLGLSLPEHGYHEPNENYDWGQASGGIKMFVKYFSEIANLR